MVPDLQAGLKEMLNKGARELVFDLASTAMLDSSGMGLLIAAANSLAPHGGKVRVTNVWPRHLPPAAEHAVDGPPQRERKSGIGESSWIRSDVAGR